MDQATLKVVIYYKSQDQQNYEGLKVKPTHLNEIQARKLPLYSFFAEMFLKENKGCKSLKIENKAAF